jgi:hypothetical protein
MRVLLLWAALAIPSWAVVAKYFGPAGVVIYSIGVAIALLFAPGIIPRIPRRYVVAMSIVTLLAVVMVFLTVYPRVNVHSPGMGSDDDDAHNVGVAALFDGESPYSSRTYLDNALHQLPGAYILAAPFVALGTSALQNLVCIPLFFLLVARRSGDRRIALGLAWIVLLLSPSVLHQIVTGSSYSWNAIWVLLSIWSVWQRPTGWLAPMFCGVAMCSRPNFLLLLPLLFGALAREHGWRRAARAVSIASITAIVLFAPFYNSTPGFGPLEAFGTLSQFDESVPGAGLGILIATAMIAIGVSLIRVDLDGLFLQCALVQAIPVISILVFSAALDSTNRWLTLTPYATFASWFVLSSHVWRRYSGSPNIAG